MRIYSKKSFQFDHPAGQEPAVVVQSLNFADVPDWVADSAMFKLASQDEDVMVIESKQDELAAETGGKSKGNGKAGKGKASGDTGADGNPDGTTEANPDAETDTNAAADPNAPPAQ